MRSFLYAGCGVFTYTEIVTQVSFPALLRPWLTRMMLCPFYSIYVIRGDVNMRRFSKWAATTVFSPN